MTGTEKQIAYANDIMNAAYSVCDQQISTAKSYIEANGNKSGLIRDLVTYMTIRKQLEGSFSTVKTASEMIEKKNIVSPQAVMNMAERMKSQYDKMDAVKKAELVKSVTGIEMEFKA